MKKILIAITITLLSSRAFGYTECPGLTLTKTHLDVDGHFFVATGGYLNGMIPHTSVNFSQSIAIAMTARASGKPALIRYANDGVICGNAAWNEQIISLGL